MNLWKKPRYTLITGGAGFIGTNLAARLAEEGEDVLLFDNLSRPGVLANLEWMLEEYPDRISFLRGDIRSPLEVKEAVEGAQSVFHFAAQVAVTTSLVHPIEDFEVNARGTLNLLEALRLRKEKERAPLVYTSTNKVLGGLDSLQLQELETRYEPADYRIRENGVSEALGINFCSPYGCSKGSADQYVLDYARTFELPAAVFRMSCIYGPHQCGNEDQGWVAHFVRQILDHKPISFFGDGKQVRDALFAEDLVDAFLAARRKMSSIQGEAFNIGGGPLNTTSLLELVQLLSDIHGSRPNVEMYDWRPSDQKYYVSDTRKFQLMTGWSPKVSFTEGVSRLYQWMKSDFGERALEEMTQLQAAGIRE